MASNLQTYGYGKKKQTPILKPSERAAQEKQYGMTDSGGGIVSTTVQPTAVRTGQTTVIKPSAIAARERQYGITDWKDTKPQTAVKPEAVPLVSARPEEKSEKQHWTKTVLDVAERGAGYGVEGLLTAADVVANAVPTVEGWIFGTDKDATFTGQVLKPITYLTGTAADWARDYNAATQARIENDTRDSRAARIVADVGSGVVGALPSVALAVLSGGTSAAAQLGTQAAGISGTAVNAANTMLHNPVVQYNFATSLGNEYNAAKANGASDMDAMTAATVSSLFNAIVESGGVEALPKQLRGTDLSTAQKAWRWLISAVSEGGEEPVQGLISEMAAKAAYAANKPYFSITDENAVINPGRMVREFGYGTAIGGITGAVPMASAKTMELWARAPRENGGRSQVQNILEVQQNETAPDSNRNGIKTDHREEISYGEGIHLRNGGQWIGGQNSGGQVSAVEAGTGRDQGRQGQVEPADSGAASLSYGQKVSTAGLGIRGGSAEANIQIVNSGETVATRAAMNIAQENGLELTLFTGENLQISNASGKTDSVRGYIEGNRVYVRADHPVYTAEQLMRHEVGHAQIARGEVNPDTVRQRITKTYGIGHTVQLSMLYAAAYEGSGMTGGEIWEEIICDSLGDMNIFQEYNVGERAGRLLNEVRESVEAETRLDRGPPAADLDVVGRMSRDNDKRNRALKKGEMVNRFRNKVNWRSYYEELQSDKYNPDYYDDGDIAYMYLDGYTLTLEMQENGEFSVIRREKGVHHGKSVGNYGSVGESDESTGISGKRNTNGDRDNRSGGQSAGNSKGSGATGRSSKNAERSGEGDAADHSQTDAVEIKGKTSRELDLSRVVAEMGGYGNFSSTDDEHLAFIKRLEAVQVRLKAEELRQEYLRNMARLEEEQREAEMDAAFWKYWD